MTLGISGIISCYILLALLLLSIYIHANVAWYIKAIAIALTSLFYVVSYLSFPPIIGWPTSENPPTQFRLLSALVTQPDKINGTDGAVYLWVQDIAGINKNMPPRAYKLPYSDDLHEKIVRVNTKLSKNVPQLGEFEDPAGLIDVPEETRRAQKSTRIQFYDLPDPLFPDKG